MARQQGPVKADSWLTGRATPPRSGEYASLAVGARQGSPRSQLGQQVAGQQGQGLQQQQGQQGPGQCSPTTGHR